MRGKVKEGFGRIVEKGITPAYAGKRHQEAALQDTA